EVMRVHPKDNETVNECWISDRDRFSYLGLSSEDRLAAPMVKRKGEWVEVDWAEALEETAKALKAAQAESSALVSPGATLEELHLLKRLMEGLGSNNIDFRLRQRDFRVPAPAFPWLGQAIADLENVNAALLIGSNVRKEQPILGHRLRKAALEDAQISFINPYEIDLNYAADQLVSTPAGMIDDLAAVAKALGLSGGLIDSATADESHQTIAQQLKDAENATVLLGNIATAHPDYAILCGLAEKIAEAANAKLGFLPEAANSVGAHLLLNGANNNAEILNGTPKAVVLLGVEPGSDFWNPVQTQQALTKADSVIALTTFRSACLEESATVMLPMAAFTETSGSYINAEGRWQSFSGVVKPVGEARPAWKILRVLGNLLDISDFDYDSSQEVLAEVQAQCSEKQPDNKMAAALPTERNSDVDGVQRIGDVPLYAIDPLVRRSSALQQTHDAIKLGVYINPDEAQQAGFNEGDQVAVSQDGQRATLTVFIDSNIPDGAVRIPAGVAGSAALAGQFGQVTLEKA
ncbi:MAG: molybdopterin-dependent oxidoreductase, partial [Chromatiales bacterium]|nr:molybdopterin-dependent oxidoreductase [Chromatiales bacterium]